MSYVWNEKSSEQVARRVRQSRGSKNAALQCRYALCCLMLLFATQIDGRTSKAVVS